MTSPSRKPWENSFADTALLDEAHGSARAPQAASTIARTPRSHHRLRFSGKFLEIKECGGGSG
jgi:hypothetical protein